MELNTSDVLIRELDKKLKNVLEECYEEIYRSEGYNHFIEKLSEELSNSLHLSNSAFHTLLSDRFSLEIVYGNNKRYTLYVGGLFYNLLAGSGEKKHNLILEKIKKVGDFCESLNDIYHILYHGEDHSFYYSYLVGEIKSNKDIQNLMKKSYATHSLLAYLERREGMPVRVNGQDRGITLLERRPLLIIPGLGERGEAVLEEWEKDKRIYYKISEKGWFMLIPHDEITQTTEFYHIR